MAARNSKGRFVKGAKRSSSTAIARRAPTRVVTRTRTRTIVKRAARRGRSMASGLNWKHGAIAAAAIAYLGSQNGPKAVRDMAMKIPGAATFGPAAMIGVTCLAADKFVRPNKYLKAAGYAGIVLAMARFGEQGSSFKFVGDDGGDDVADLDLADADDVGDDDEG